MLPRKLCEGRALIWFVLHCVPAPTTLMATCWAFHVGWMDGAGEAGETNGWIWMDAQVDAWRGERMNEWLEGWMVCL